MHEDPRPLLRARAVAIINPTAGGAQPGEVANVLRRHLPGIKIVETTKEDICGELVREALAAGADLIIAAGGDGTVSAVANALVGSGLPLAIIPRGTANVLVRELAVPVELDEAVTLASSGGLTRTIDAIKVRDRHYFTQVGVGIDAFMIRDTTHEQKRRFGRVAYLWTACVRL